MAENNQRFDSFQQWVNKASSWLTRHPRYSGNFRAICFDSAGRICLSGKEFARARDEKTFPVYWIWPDQSMFQIISILSPYKNGGELSTIGGIVRHMGLLGLLAECAIHVDEDTRHSIERALTDNLPDGWTYRRVLDRIEIFPPQEATLHEQ